MTLRAEETGERIGRFRGESGEKAGVVWAEVVLRWS
jgi:hypothetical protein